ncbi:cytochrome bd biosynthesis ABC transporter ATPase and permease [Streptococcus pyogenes]|nr:cytochrome bd biosynthesis ABC transporter ATPase and permease [Streptococcus pyogenes]VGR28113.1 cytochrome bd biosynthesis ABC transporter ATPase and permease [Streptococcus pyogenes]VGX82358.1 cytochrome bd biosynthesis ABC transporter ATPase and permease [Streptococcus pyogenes]VGY95755.1 cytochrome bd biosynthesis ABC transporter ATPase and permease [Streptococcus pyogenes]VGZ07233.1 cytochrome bd biosynthesis ABC transporter ATPase and permease [Streptococcus pyogenes]
MINGVSHYLAQTPTLTLFLICHVLSDYQLQSQQVADLKEKHLTYLGYHLIGVSIPLICLTLIIPQA